MRNKVWSLWCALPNSPGVVFPTRRVRQNSRRLVKSTSRSGRLGSTRRFNHAEKAVFCFGNTLFARAYIRILFPEKSIHSFTRRAFSTDFHRFRVWRVGLSKYSHGSRSIHNRQLPWEEVILTLFYHSAWYFPSQRLHLAERQFAMVRAFPSR